MYVNVIYVIGDVGLYHVFMGAVNDISCCLAYGNVILCFFVAYVNVTLCVVTYVLYYVNVILCCYIIC